MTNTSKSAFVQRHTVSKIRQSLRKAFDSDRYACENDYTDRDGKQTARTISPIRFTSEDATHVMALCLGREEVRKFAIAGIREIELVDASEVQMTEAIKEGKS